MADLIKAVHIKNLVPENKQKDLDFNNNLKKIQSQNRSVMGPLSKYWTAFESVRLSQECLVEADLKARACGTNCAATGKASNSISHYRRFYKLLALTNSPDKSNQTLKKDLELLPKNDNLFRKEFREIIRHTSKSKKQTLEMLSNTSQTKYKPFRHGLPQTPMEEFRRAATTKASSKKRKDIKVFEKMMQ